MFNFCILDIVVNILIIWFLSSWWSLIFFETLAGDVFLRCLCLFGGDVLCVLNWSVPKTSLWSVVTLYTLYLPSWVALPWRSLVFFILVVFRNLLGASSSTSKPNQLPTRPQQKHHKQYDIRILMSGTQRNHMRKCVQKLKVTCSYRLICSTYKATTYNLSSPITSLLTLQAPKHHLRLPQTEARKEKEKHTKTHFPLEQQKQRTDRWSDWMWFPAPWCFGLFFSNSRPSGFHGQHS